VQSYRSDGASLNCRKQVYTHDPLNECNGDITSTTQNEVK